MTRRALVIGGSLGGLLAAHLLRQAGWHTVVFERNEEALTGRGVGLGTHPQLIAALRRAGIAFDATMGITVAKVVRLDRAGNIMVEQPTARTMSAWSWLYRALRDALPAQDYRLGKKLRQIEQDARSVTAIFEDNTSERGDLLVRRRRHPFHRARAISATGTAHLCRLRGVARRVGRSARAARRPPRHFRALHILSARRRAAARLSGAGHDGDTVPGRRRYNVVWYRPADSPALDDMCTDVSGQLHSGGIAPSLIRHEVIARVKADAEALLAPQLAEIFLRSEPFFQPIFDLESPALAFGRAALTGDAAFVVRPHVGAGASKAAIDATVFVDCLDRAGEDVAGGLAHFESVQLPFGRDMVALSRQQGAYLSAQLKPMAQRRGGELRRDVAALLHAHGNRSDQIGEVVAARGLEVYF
jgi:2-polyprenyl-6-methoxyphenol hydroxylase-like FAD-dependent oxidoreductase